MSGKREKCLSVLSQSVTGMLSATGCDWFYWWLRQIILKMKAEQPQLRTGNKWELKSLPIFFPQSKNDPSNIKDSITSNSPKKKKKKLSQLFGEFWSKFTHSCICIISKAAWVINSFTMNYFHMVLDLLIAYPILYVSILRLNANSTLTPGIAYSLMLLASGRVTKPWKSTT